MAKIKLTITIDEDALKKAKEDAAKNDRTLSGHINRIIKEYRSPEDGSGAVITSDALEQILEAIQATRKPTGSIGRPRKQKPIDIQAPDGYGQTLMLKNRTKQRGLVVFYDAGDYMGTAQYIRDALVAGDFEREDAQRDYTDACDTFTIYEIQQDTPEAAIAAYAGEFDLYPGWLDLSEQESGVSDR